MFLYMYLYMAEEGIKDKVCSKFFSGPRKWRSSLGCRRIRILQLFSSVDVFKFFHCAPLLTIIAYLWRRAPQWSTSRASYHILIGPS